MAATSTAALPHALTGDRREVDGRAGRLSYFCVGEGRPMLLVHSINAAASAYEVKPVYDYFTRSRRGYAPDLPGFGLSDRSDRDYTVRLYTDAIHDMLDVIGEEYDGPVDVFALSLSAEFAARAAVERPERFATLTLVTPTGFRRGSSRLRAAEGETREMGLMKSILGVRSLRRGLFGLLTKPGTIRYFLKRTYGSSDFDEGLAAYDDLTAQQPGAQHAPAAFLSGSLFSRDIRNVYEKLAMPVWVPHGTKGDFKDFSDAAWTVERDNWTLLPFDSGALPHFEQSELFCESYVKFLAEAGHG